MAHPARYPVTATLWLCLSITTAHAGDDVDSNDGAEQLAAFQAPAAVVDRSAIVEKEIAALGEHPWAGSYYLGDGLGMNVKLSIAPTAGVAATWMGCLGMYGSNEGIVEPQSDGSLQLVLNRPNKQGFGGFDEHLQPVRWGERHYLIPVDALEAFVSAVNLGDEPRSRVHGEYALRIGDEEKPVDGLPELPAAVRAHLRSEPLLIRPSAVSVDKTSDRDGWCEKTYRVQLPYGSADGIAVGVRLKTNDLAHYENLYVRQAQPHAASGELTVFGRSCAGLPQPDTTWVFTTGAYREQPAE